MGVYKRSKSEGFDVGVFVEPYFQPWERAGVEPAREVIRRIYSPMLSTDQPSFLYVGQLLGIEPSAVESQSTILPINYSCQRAKLFARYRTRTDTSWRVAFKATVSTISPSGRGTTLQ